MKTPDRPANEESRLRAVRDLGKLDNLPEEIYDNITSLAQEICETPVALLTVVDKDIQWFKSKQGFAMNETDREISFCGHAILNPKELFEVPDTLKDPRFIDNPLVTFEDFKVRAYAGVPIVNSDGHAIGTLCVINKKPKKLNPKQKKSLIALARQVELLYDINLKSI